jgi:hypothetical protein
MNRNVANVGHTPWRDKGTLRKLSEVVIVTFWGLSSQNIPRYPLYKMLCGVGVAAKGKPYSLSFTSILVWLPERVARRRKMDMG